LSSEVANLQAQCRRLACGDEATAATEAELSQIEDEVPSNFVIPLSLTVSPAAENRLSVPQIGNEGELRSNGRSDEADRLDAEIAEQLKDLYARISPALGQ
jgi:hypothetical protein